MEKKSAPKLFTGLLCGMAVCCALMYVTSDGDNEIMRPSAKMPPSVYSIDVLKVGTIFTATPAGNGRLLDYFKLVERKIRAERHSRNIDLTKVNALIARNQAINQAARKKMKKALDKQMAANAKRAQAALKNTMRRVQAQFAAAARLANQRQAMLNKRFGALKRTINANKRAAAADLKAAVLAQQRALSAKSASLNAKIRQTNQRIAANSAQMAANAKAARARLAKTMSNFNSKLINLREEARKGRSRFAAQMAAQDKRTRAWASSKLAKVINDTAAQFKKVRGQMAKDRARADRMIQKAAGSLTRALNAQKALSNKRYAQTVGQLNKAKKEAARNINRASQDFKMSMLQLTATAKRQETKLNERVNSLSGVVEKNRLAQAKVNRKLSAEMKRVINIGAAREAKRLGRDRRLRGLIAKNKRIVNSRLQRMKASFNNGLSKLRKYAKKSRKMASEGLARQTAALARSMMKMQLEQRKKNVALAAATARARLDAMQAVRQAKDRFRRGMKGLTNKVAQTERKQGAKYMKLCGIVATNAARSARGRKLLRSRQNAAKQDMQNALNQAIAKGERRNRKLEKQMKNMDKATRNSLNQKISAQIKSLKAWTNRSIQQVRMEGKRERAALRREMTIAISAAKNEAKKSLQSAFKGVSGRMQKAAKLAAQMAKANAAQRAALERRIKAARKKAETRLTAAVVGLNRARLAMANQVSKKIKKTNARVDARAKRLAGNVQAVSSKMAATVASIDSQINRDAAAAKKGVQSGGKLVAQQMQANAAFMRKALEKATKRSDRQFNMMYRRMAKMRAQADKQLAASVNQINDSIAKQAALADGRFSKTVKDIAAARAAAAAQVKAARKAYATGIVSVTALVKNSSQRMQGEINVVSGQVLSNSRQQAKINRKVSKEINGIIGTQNKRFSASRRARGKIRALMNRNKALAARMVGALSTYTRKQLAKVRANAARARLAAASDLSQATKRFYKRTLQVTLVARQAASKGRINKAKRITTQGKLRAAGVNFGVQLNLLTNQITANARSTARKIGRLTGVQRKIKVSAAERANVRRQQRALSIDLNRAVVRAVQIGEAKAKAAADRAVAILKLKGAFALKNAVSQKTERRADKEFASVNGNRQRIADNYLSMKAYCVAAKGGFADYNLAKYKSKSVNALVSIGDFCMSIGKLANLGPKKAYGVGLGRGKVMPLFGAKKFTVAASLKKVNGLVNEYMRVVTQVRNRWGMGIGKYLLKKLQNSVQGKGCLEISRVGVSRRNHKVFINSRAVGLSNKVQDFKSLAVTMAKYEKTLAMLTTILARKAVSKRVKPFKVRPPQWEGN